MWAQGLTICVLIAIGILPHQAHAQAAVHVCPIALECLSGHRLQILILSQQRPVDHSWSQLVRRRSLGQAPECPR